MELFQGLLLSSMSPRSPYGGMPVSGTPWDLILANLVPGVGSVRSFCPHFVSKDNSYHNCFCEFQSIRPTDDWVKDLKETTRSENTKTGGDFLISLNNGYGLHNLIYLIF